MTAAVEVRAVRKSFAGTPVLTGIDLTVERGTIIALLGPNGAGKTTLINILSTLVAPDSGSATVEGADVVGDPAGVRRRIRLTGQSAAVDGLLTGEENLWMMGRLSGLSRAASRSRATDLLRQFDLADAAGRRVATYSGGMRRRLDLAISAVVAVPVVFLDEPTTGLDLRSRRQLWDVIRAMRADGITVLLTTQYLEEADELADHVAVLRDGTIIAQGTAAELKTEVAGEVVELHGAGGELVARAPTDGSVGGLRAALDTLDADGLEGVVSVRRPSLDDVFLALTDPAATPPVNAARHGKVLS